MVGLALCVDAELSASSARSGAGEEAQKARLNARGAGWSPMEEGMASSWLQVDLGALHVLTGLATQGSDADACWTTSYEVSHSADGVAWTAYVENAALGERTFSANTDQRTVEVRAFRAPFQCRYVRVHPKAWHERAALRVEVYGAPASHEPDEGVVYALESRSGRFLHSRADTPGAAVGLGADGAARCAELTFSRASDGADRATVWRASVAGAELGIASSASSADGAAITTGARNPALWIVRDAGEGWVRLIAQESTGSMCASGGGGGADAAAGGAVLLSMSPSILKSNAAHWRLRRIDALRRRAAEAEAERAAAEAELALTTTGEAKLGIADGAFALSASSERDARAAADAARLHQRHAAWSPHDGAVHGSWLEVDLGEARCVSGIATQGCSGGAGPGVGPGAAASGAPCWTTSYAVSHSADGVAWAAYEENAALGERTFSANADAQSVAIRAFRAPFTSRYVRVHPKSWRGRAALRIELYGPRVAAAPAAAEEGDDEWRELTRLATQIAYFYCALVPRSLCADRVAKARSAFQTAARYLHVEEHLQVALRDKYGVEFVEELPAGWTPPDEVAEALARAQRAHAALTRRVCYFFLESLGGAAAAAAAAEEEEEERAPLFLRASNASAIAAKWAYIETELWDRLESKYGVSGPAASEIPAAWRAPSAASLRLAAAEAEDRVGDAQGDGSAPQCGEIDAAAKVAWKAPEDINLQLTKILADIARGSARASALLV